jgi:hypothetical protein
MIEVDDPLSGFGSSPNPLVSDRNMDNEMDFAYGPKPIIWRVYSRRM